MSESITQQLDEAMIALEAVQSVAELAGVETRYLGRDKGLNELRRGIRSLPAEERPAFGARINEAVTLLTERIAATRDSLQAREMEARAVGTVALSTRCSSGREATRRGSAVRYGARRIVGSGASRTSGSRSPRDSNQNSTIATTSSFVIHACSAVRAMHDAHAAGVCTRAQPTR